MHIFIDGSTDKHLYSRAEIVDAKANEAKYFRELMNCRQTHNFRDKQFYFGCQFLVSC